MSVVGLPWGKKIKHVFPRSWEETKKKKSRFSKKISRFSKKNHVFPRQDVGCRQRGGAAHWPAAQTFLTILTPQWPKSQNPKTGENGTAHPTLSLWRHWGICGTPHWDRSSCGRAVVIYPGGERYIKGPPPCSHIAPCCCSSCHAAAPVVPPSHRAG